MIGEGRTCTMTAQECDVFTYVIKKSYKEWKEKRNIKRERTNMRAKKKREGEEEQHDEE